MFIGMIQQYEYKPNLVLQNYGHTFDALLVKNRPARSAEAESVCLVKNQMW